MAKAHRLWLSTILSYTVSIPPVRAHRDGDILFYTCLQAVSVTYFASIFTVHVSANPDDSTAQENPRRADVELKLSKSLIISANQVNGGPLGQLVGNLTHIFVTSVSCRTKWLNQISVYSMKGSLHISVFGLLGVGQLAAFPYGTNVAFFKGAVEGNGVTV